MNITEQIREAIKNNPNIPIYFAVGEYCNGGDFSYCWNEAQKVEIGFITTLEETERIYFQNDVRELEEDITNRFLEDVDIPLEDIDDMVSYKLSRIEWEECITIYIGE